MAHVTREYGLNNADRIFEIQRKFGTKNVAQITEQLGFFSNQIDQVLGAIVFLARENQVEDIVTLVKLANENQDDLLRAATVKDERG